MPHEAKTHHEKVSNKILVKALKEANLDFQDIDIIAYSCGPGLPPTLLFTANFSIEIAERYNKILIPVNHGIAHIEIGKLKTGSKDPVIVYLSGGHTSIVAFVEGRYRIFGETEDIPIGNALDIVARELGLLMPGGPQIEKLAEKGKYIELPYVVKGMDLSFSGIVTAATKKYKEGIPKADICYSMQETCFSMLTEVTERALAHTGKKEVLLVGGVAANKRLQKMLTQMCKDRDAKIYVVPSEYSGDHGAQIAWTGILAYKSGWKADFTDKIKPNWRIDEVEITWV